MGAESLVARLLLMLLPPVSLSLASHLFSFRITGMLSTITLAQHYVGLVWFSVKKGLL